MHLATPDWLHHRLSVTGPPAPLAAFRQAAAGAGVVPFAFDSSRFAEDWFYRLMADQHRQPRRHRLSPLAARRLAAQVSELCWQEHEYAAAQLGRGRGCVFDLHALVPVPWEILRLGFADPAATAWLWCHWGTTWPLRRVRLLTPPPGTAAWACEFYAADWSPWPALAAIQTRFSELSFSLQPSYS
jgi:hypothetical protein